jgi:hypothetical protein
MKDYSFGTERSTKIKDYHLKGCMQDQPLILRTRKYFTVPGLGDIGILKLNIPCHNRTLLFQGINCRFGSQMITLGKIHLRRNAMKVSQGIPSLAGTFTKIFGFLI